jgi:phosphoribosylformylglycinamidine cyclo-ligase
LSSGIFHFSLFVFHFGMSKPSFTYKAAGVDVTANTTWVNRIRHAMQSTYTPRVCNRHNAFAGMFRLDFDEQLFRRNYRQPVLVGCADGVGTKVLLAVEVGDYTGLGIDLVAMNVNDLITCGAEPLFFLDYFGVHNIDPEAMLPVIESIAEGCKQAGCALLGGETAEMPDIYGKGHLDLAGFSVGVVELRRTIDPKRVRAGDVLIGLHSSGVHSNGYTLVRKVVAERKLKLDAHYPELGETLQAALLRPTRIYAKPVIRLLRGYSRKRVVSAMAHITGGGLAENVERSVPEGLCVTIDSGAWTPPPIFKLLADQGIEREEMLRVFNMGIGFVVIVRPDFAAGVMRRLKRAGEHPVVLGEVRRGEGGVVVS